MINMKKDEEGEGKEEQEQVEKKIQEEENK